MRVFLAASAAACLAAGGAAAGVAAEVLPASSRHDARIWTEDTVGLVVKYRQNPLRASRALAVVHAAMDEG